MSKETIVKCDVVNCQHNEKEFCILNKLDISCTCDGYDCCKKQETICKSFKPNQEK